VGAGLRGGIGEEGSFIRHHQPKSDVVASDFRQSIATAGRAAVPSTVKLPP